MALGDGGGADGEGIGELQRDYPVVGGFLLHG